MPKFRLELSVWFRVKPNFLVYLTNEQILLSACNSANYPLFAATLASLYESAIDHRRTSPARSPPPAPIKSLPSCYYYYYYYYWFTIIIISSTAPYRWQCARAASVVLFLLSLLFCALSMEKSAPIESGKGCKRWRRLIGITIYYSRPVL